MNREARSIYRCIHSVEELVDAHNLDDTSVNLGATQPNRRTWRSNRAAEAVDQEAAR